MTNQRKRLIFSAILILFLAQNVFQNNQTQALATDIVFDSLSTIITPSPRNLAVSGDYLYIADEMDGLLIYDITNKNAPFMETSSYYVNVTDVFISGNFAFLTSQEGLVVIDISDPTNPMVSGVFSDSQLLNMTEVFVSGNRAYVIDKLNGVFSIDLTNFGSMFIENNFAVSANSIWFDGFYLYIAQNDSIMQVSSNGNFVVIDNQVSVNFRDITVQGSFGYSVAGTQGLLIYDLNNFQTISGVNVVGLESMIDVSVFGSYVFISQGSDPLRVIDVSDKQNPRDISVIYQSGNLQNLLHTYVYQNLIYTINSDNEVDIQSWDFLEVIDTETQIETSTTSLTETITQNRTVTADTTITVIETSTTILNLNITSTLSTYLETVTLTDTYNTTVEFTKNTSSALTDEILFTSKNDGENAGIPSFMFPLTFTSVILISTIRKK